MHLQSKPWLWVQVSSWKETSFLKVPISRIKSSLTGANVGMIWSMSCQEWFHTCFFGLFITCNTAAYFWISLSIYTLKWKYLCPRWDKQLGSQPRRTHFWRGNLLFHGFTRYGNGFNSLQWANYKCHLLCIPLCILGRAPGRLEQLWMSCK